MRFGLLCYSFLCFSCSPGRTASAVASSPDLQFCTACQFSDGLQVVQVDPLASGVTARTVNTAAGPKQVSMLSGIRILFAYPKTDIFANVKAEQPPVVDYQQLKQILKESLDYALAATPATKRNDALAPALRGLSAYGLDRDRLEGAVMGIYLLFDDSKHAAITIYFLNQDSPQRSYQTLDDYRKLRDRFLSAYAACMRNHS